MSVKISLNILSKSIFIGGTGRSGTSIMSKYLGTHSNIYQIPIETKFIGDKDGLIDLHTALTTNFNIVQGKVAINRFSNLLFSIMNEPNKSPYIGYNLNSLVGLEFLEKQKLVLMNLITKGEWYGWDKHTNDRFASLYNWKRIFGKVINKLIINPLNGIIPNGLKISHINPKKIFSKEWMFIPKYFSNEKELESILGSFVKSLFFEMSKLNGKIHYCEATPSNMLHVDFIHSIIPDAYFLHITRNPIGVAFSMAQKNRLWAPNNVDDVVNFLSSIYEKLLRMEEYAIRNNIGYKRIKLEECSSKNTLIDINTFLGIDNKFDGSVNFISSKVDYWADKYHPEIIQQYKNKLSKYINYFGY